MGSSNDAASSRCVPLLPIGAPQGVARSRPSDREQARLRALRVRLVRREASTSRIWASRANVAARSCGEPRGRAPPTQSDKPRKSRCCSSSVASRPSALLDGPNAPRYSRHASMDRPRSGHVRLEAPRLETRTLASARDRFARAARSDKTSIVPASSPVAA